MADLDFTPDSQLVKICTRCGTCKPLDAYYAIKREKPLKRNIATDGRKTMCKDCYVKRASEWKKANPEKRQAIAKKWEEANKEKRNNAAAAYNKLDSTRQRQKQWRLMNSVSYQRARRQSDPMYAFKIKMRAILLKAFARNGYTKRSKSNEILGCEWSEFVKHIERQFINGMNWGNRGMWHIDHIVPLATAKSEEELVKLNHFTNMRPLWASDNLTKNDQITHLI